MKNRYFLLNKPYGVLCQFTAEPARACLKDLFPVPGMYPCGRLDADSEGLLLLCDDGAFQARIASPGSKLWKTYLVQVEGIPTPDALRALREGVEIECKRTLPAQARLLEDAPGFAERIPPVRFRRSVPTSWLEIRLREGRNRQVRRMTAAVGFPTLRLVRVSIGPFTLDGLDPGLWRELSGRELSEMSMPPKAPPGRGGRTRRGTTRPPGGVRGSRGPGGRSGT